MATKRRRTTKKRAASSKRTPSRTKKKRAPRSIAVQLQIPETISVYSDDLLFLTSDQRLELGAFSTRMQHAAKRGDPTKKAPSWASDHDKWSEAVRMVKPQWRRMREPWAGVALAYRAIGGPVRTPGAYRSTEPHMREPQDVREQQQRRAPPKRARQQQQQQRRPPAQSGSGYTPCSCRDCFDTSFSRDMRKPELCTDCAQAGCMPNSGECQRSDAYGG